MEHLDHITRSWELNVCLRWLLVISLLCFWHVGLNEANWSLEYARGILLLELVLVFWDSDGWTELVRLDLVVSLDCWRIVEVYQIVLICVLNCQSPISTAFKVYPLQ